MQELYHPQIIPCRNHFIRLSLKTGSHGAKPSKVVRWDKPPYEKGATCPEFNAILSQQFSLCLEPVEVERHFWECLGYLLCPSEILPVKVAFYGEDGSAKNQIASLVLPMVASEKSDNVAIVSKPPDRVHCDYDIAHTTAIPFYNVYHRVSEIPVYDLDRIKQGELSGILNEALEGVKRLILRGHLDPPKDCIEAAAKYLRAVDHLGSFLREKVVSVDDIKVRVAARDMYDAYLLWSTEPKMTINRTEMVQEMTARGYEYRSRAGYRREFLGVALIK